MAREASGPPAPTDGAPHPPAGARRFTDAEVADILRRATSREERAPLPVARDVTLDDLMEVAREVGLDPGAVRRAAAVQPAAGGRTAALLFGAPDHREVRALLAGVGLPEDRQVLVAASERACGRRGDVLDSGPRSFAWREDHTAGRTAVELVGTDEGVELRVSADRAGHYLVAWFLGLMAWAAVSALTPVGSLALLPKVLSFLVAPFLLARPWWTRRDRALRHRLEAFALDLLEVVEHASGQGAPGNADALPPGAP